MLSSQFFQHFHFLRPEWGLLLVLPLLTLLLQWRQQDESQAWNSIIAPHLLQALRLRQFRNRLFSPVSAGALLMLLLTVIVMGPSWRQQSSPLTRDEAALVILLDVSRSMGQKDVQPSRLQRAKQKLSDLLALRGGSRTALVVYAGSAHTVLDLTDDADILNQYLAAIDKDIMPRSGKFAEYGLPKVDRIIGESLAPTTVLLVSDGVSSATEADFQAWFEQRPHQLLVWGIGLESDDPDASGAPLESRALQALASAAGGSYIGLSIDKTDVRGIHRRVNAHYVVTADNAVPWLDSGYWLVFPALVLFALWFRRGWTLQWCMAGVLLLGSLQAQPVYAQGNWFADLWLTPDQQGRLLLERGDYQEAANRFSSPMWKGIAYYYAEEFKLAAEYFSRVDSPAAHFNRANALAQGQDYLLAVRIYQELLREDPNNRAAEKNRRIVQDVIDAINLMSESQMDEEASSSRELGDDQPQRAEGAEREMNVSTELEQFSAEEILQDEKINEMWMRSVQRDPSHFLAVKFSMQLEQPEP
ncbi:MAG: VWA domain-containing protein [Halieaceae bacterium]